MKSLFCVAVWLSGRRHGRESSRRNCAFQWLSEQGVRFVFSQEVKGVTAAQRQPLVLAVNNLDAAEALKEPYKDVAARLNPHRASADHQCHSFFRGRAKGRRQGFGCLFPPQSRGPLLGFLMNSCVFPHRVRQGWSETWILGGTSEEMQRWLKSTDQEILRLIRRKPPVATRSICPGFRVSYEPLATRPSLLHRGNWKPCCGSLRGICLAIFSCTAIIWEASDLRRF